MPHPIYHNNTTKMLGPGQTVLPIVPTFGSELSFQHSWEFSIQPPHCFLVPFRGTFSGPVSMYQRVISSHLIQEPVRWILSLSSDEEAEAQVLRLQGQRELSPQLHTLWDTHWGWQHKTERPKPTLRSVNVVAKNIMTVY